MVIFKNTNQVRKSDICNVSAKTLTAKRKAIHTHTHTHTHTRTRTHAHAHAHAPYDGKIKNIYETERCLSLFSLTRTD